MENSADLISGFASLKFIPMPIVIATNNANPKLDLYEDHIEYRGGFISGQLSYDEIESIDVYFWRIRTNNIVISKKNGVWTFIGNFKDRNQLRKFLKFFKSKGCTLTEKAVAEMNNTAI